MTETARLCDLSAEGLRGYALALRDMSHRLPSLRDDLRSDAVNIEGFAARLGAIEMPAEPANAGRGETTVYWLAADPEAGNFDSPERAMDSVPTGEAAEIASNAWRETRWAAREIVTDAGNAVTLWADNEAALLDYLAGFAAGEGPESNAAGPAAQDNAEASTEALPPAKARTTLTQPEHIKASAKALILEGAPLSDISAKLNVPITTISGWATREGWRKEQAPRPPRASDGPPSKAELSGARPWTPERLALLAQLFPTGIKLTDLLTRLNALPGDAIHTLDALRAKAAKIGLSRQGQPIPPEHQPTPHIAPRNDRTQPPPEPMTTEDKAEALARLRRGADKGARDLMEYFGCTADEAMDLVQQYRATAGTAA